MPLPDWPLLQDTASAQAGYFSIDQARSAGYSSQVLRHHCSTGRFERVRRGIYRLSGFPTSAREHLVVLWLWSRQRGIFSHGTALTLHDLSDLLPERVHMTLPKSERSQRRSIPAGLVLHYAEVPDSDRVWHDYVPVTSPKRTMLDCIADSLSPELLEQALDQALARGLLDVSGVNEVSAGIENLKGQ